MPHRSIQSAAARPARRDHIGSIISARSSPKMIRINAISDVALMQNTWLAVGDNPTGQNERNAVRFRMPLPEQSGEITIPRLLTSSRPQPARRRYMGLNRTVLIDLLPKPFLVRIRKICELNRSVWHICSVLCVRVISPQQRCYDPTILQTHDTARKWY